ncbi:6774_t:CDS:10, partial [Entrophospora sp. SA101]
FVCPLFTSLFFLGKRESQYEEELEVDECDNEGGTLNEETFNEETHNEETHNESNQQNDDNDDDNKHKGVIVYSAEENNIPSHFRALREGETLTDEQIATILEHQDEYGYLTRYAELMKNDELLPAYGDSDPELYDYSSEFEAEVYESEEEAEIKRNQSYNDNDSNQNSQNSQIDQIDQNNNNSGNNDNIRKIRYRIMPKYSKREYYYWKKYHSESSIELLVADIRKLRDTRLTNICENLLNNINLKAINSDNHKKIFRQFGATDQTLKEIFKLRWLIKLAKSPRNVRDEKLTDDENSDATITDEELTDDNFIDDSDAPNIEELQKLSMELANNGIIPGPGKIVKIPLKLNPPVKNPTKSKIVKKHKVKKGKSKKKGSIKPLEEIVEVEGMEIDEQIMDNENDSDEQMLGIEEPRPRNGDFLTQEEVAELEKDIVSHVCEDDPIVSESEPDTEELDERFEKLKSFVAINNDNDEDSLIIAAYAFRMFIYHLCEDNAEYRRLSLDLDSDRRIFFKKFIVDFRKQVANAPFADDNDNGEMNEENDSSFELENSPSTINDDSNDTFSEIEEDDERCVLAHSMGLGKTMQIITFLATLKIRILQKDQNIPEHLNDFHVVIVCPKIVMENWENEFNKWLDKNSGLNNLIRVYKYSSNRSFEELELWWMNGGALLIGYEMLRSYLKSDSDSKYFLNSSLFIADEGHILKTATTILPTKLRELVTKSRIVLTGTPLQNNLKAATISSASKEKSAAKTNHNSNDMIFQSNINVNNAFNSANINPTYFYNNPTVTKNPQNDPQKLVNHSFLPTTVTNSNPQFTFAGPTMPVTFNQTPTSPSEPVIIDLTADDDDNNAVEETELTSAWMCLDKLASTIKNIDNYELSSKLVILKNLLETFRSHNDKALIFTRSIPSLEWNIEPRKSYMRIDGHVQSNRQSMINSFNANLTWQVALISTHTCGVGINLYGANRVVLFDVEWNPSYADQAIGRVYRYGQKKSVYSYRLLTAGTFEESLFLNNVFKMGLSYLILDNKNTLLHENLSRCVMSIPDPNLECRLKDTLNFDDDALNTVGKDLRDQIIDIRYVAEYFNSDDRNLNEEETKEAENIFEQEKERLKTRRQS